MSSRWPVRASAFLFFFFLNHRDCWRLAAGLLFRTPHPPIFTVALCNADLATPSRDCNLPVGRPPSRRNAGYKQHSKKKKEREKRRGRREKGGEGKGGRGGGRRDKGGEGEGKGWVGGGGEKEEGGREGGGEKKRGNRGGGAVQFFLKHDVAFVPRLHFSPHHHAPTLLRLLVHSRIYWRNVRPPVTPIRPVVSPLPKASSVSPGSSRHSGK